MTYKEIADMIKGIGVPFAYNQFAETGQEPPFICFMYSDRNDMLADDSNYQKIEQLTVELYTEQKDFTLEAAVEEALTDAGLVYSKNEIYIFMGECILFHPVEIAVRIRVVLHNQRMSRHEGLRSYYKTAWRGVCRGKCISLTDLGSLFSEGFIRK